MTEEIDPPDPETAPTQAQLISELREGAVPKAELGDRLGLEPTGLDSAREALRRRGLDIPWERQGQIYAWTLSEHDRDSLSAGSDSDEETADADDAGESDSAEVPDLSTAQKKAAVAFPATIGEIASAIGGDEHDAHAVLDLFRADAVEVRYDGDTGQYYLADDRADQIRSQAHVSPTQKTKVAKRALREEHARLNRLGSVDPLVIEDRRPDPDRETLVAALGDIHFGDRYYDDRSRILYDFDYADFCVDAFAESVVRTARQWQADHDECVLAILGDVATGTRIYEEQQLEVEGLLAEQIDRASQALVRLVTTLSEHFETVRVRAVVGNHGLQDPSAARGSNTDLIVYKWVEWALADRGVDNVDVLYGEKTHWLNFSVRGWNVHMRHGQDTQRHIDETARSEADWRGWLDSHNYDIGLRGHHHVPSQHWVLNRYPVASVPSPVPGGEFADRLGEPDASNPVERPAERKLGYVFGVSEDRRMTDDRIIDAAGVDAEL